MVNQLSKFLTLYLEKSEIDLVDIREFLYKASPLIKVNRMYFISFDNSINFRISKFIFDPLTFEYLDNSIIDSATIKQLEKNIDQGKLTPEINDIFFPESDCIAFYIRINSGRFFCLLEQNEFNKDLLNQHIEFLRFIFKSLMDKSVNSQFTKTSIPPSQISLTKIIDKISQIIIVSDLKDYTIYYANQYAQKVFGRELSGEKCHALLFGKNKPCSNCTHRDLNGDNVQKNIYHKALNKYFDLYYQFIESESGNRYKIATLFDVTENELKRQELAQKLQLIDIQQKALDKTAIVIIRNKDGNVLYCNPKFYESFKYSPNEIIGNAYINTEQMAPYIEQIAANVRKGKIWRGEMLLQTKYEEPIWIDATIMPFLVKTELQIITIAYDITESKKRDKEIRSLARAVEYSPASIVITDIDGYIQFVNPKFTTTTGYSLEEAIGKNPRILKSGAMQDFEYKQLWDTISNGKTWRGYFHNKTKNGEYFWEAASISPVFDESNNIINYIAVKEDVTERRKIETALSNSLALIRTAIESINEGIIAFDRDGNYISVNSVFLKLWNLQEVEISSLKEDEIFSLFAGSVVDIIHYQNILENVNSNSSASYFDRIDLIDGQIYELTVKPLVQDEQNIGRLWSFRNVTESVRSEEKLRFYMANLEKAKEESEDQATYLAKAVSELEISKEKAESATKVKSEFIANISHEIRTPLNAVIGFTELMREEEITPRQKEYLDSISNSGKNLLVLINDILDLSKIESGKLELQFESVDVQNIFREIYEIFQYKIDKNKLKFELLIDETLPKKVFIDEVRLRQILFNLVGNAVKFTESGFIRLELNAIIIDNKPGLVDLQIIVADSGIGISENMQQNIFDSFTQQSGQSNRKYGGTGLGLAITKKLVEMIGGTIALDSKVGAGAKFTVILNDIKACNKDQQIEPSANSMQSNKIEFLPSTIIAADDISVNLKLIEGMLRNQPIRIINASNGAEAVQFAGEGLPDLFLMDFRMPVMDGEQAAKIIRSMYPDTEVKIISLTAASLTKIELEELKLVFDDYLIKPFNREELLEMLAKYLPFKLATNDSKQMYNKFEPEIEYFSIGQITENEINNAQKVFQKLNTEVMDNWENAKKLSIVDGIKKFATDILHIAEDNSLDTLNAYSKKLLKEAMNFDFENFPTTMKLYPEIIAKYLKN